MIPGRPHRFRALLLVTDAFGGSGGIAKFNRDFITALATMPECTEVVIVPRIMPDQHEAVPTSVKFLIEAAGGKLRFVCCALKAALHGRFDLVISAHINLSVLGVFLAWLKRARSVLIIHGIDAWQPHRNLLVRLCLPYINCIIAVSKVTLQRFGKWAHTDEVRSRLLPNCVDLDRFTPGPKPADLAGKLGLTGKTVIMTLGRLAGEERQKGFDEVIAALPELARKVPNICYLICGDGADRTRLEEKARSLGVRDRVVFAGLITDARKADYYRLADAYVMPSRGEGFGIVFLEALACGLPAMGSTEDGGREALLDGALGELVDPANTGEVVTGIMKTLARQKGVPERLPEFSTDAFYKRSREIINEVLQCQ